MSLDAELPTPLHKPEVQVSRSASLFVFTGCAMSSF